MREGTYGEVTVKQALVYEWRKRFHNGHKATGFIRMTTHIHIDRWWSKSNSQAECDCLEASVAFLENVLVSATGKYSERTKIYERRESHCKSGPIAVRVVEVWLPGMVPNAL
jgi:hypothetical protein